MEFLQNLPDLVRLLFALCFVMALMGGLAFVLKRLGLAGAEPLARSGKRLQIIEKLPLDARRQLVLLQRDNIQHLVILGPNGETVVENNIEAEITE